MQGTLRPDRRDLLYKIDFPWDASEKLWKQWHALYDELKLLSTHKKPIYTPETLGRQLYNWVGKQRLLNLRGTLDPKRKALLDDIGFEWTERLG